MRCACSSRPGKAARAASCCPDRHATCSLQFISRQHIRKTICIRNAFSCVCFGSFLCVFFHSDTGVSALTCEICGVFAGDLAGFQLRPPPYADAVSPNPLLQPPILRVSNNLQSIFFWYKLYGKGVLMSLISGRRNPPDQEHFFVHAEGRVRVKVSPQYWRYRCYLWGEMCHFGGIDAFFLAKLVLFQWRDVPLG